MTVANTTPIFPGQPDYGWVHTDGDGGAAGPLKTANNVYDGTGTCLTIFTAGSAGDLILGVRFMPAGANIQTVARIFLNNGSTNATLGNNVLIGDLTLPSLAAASAVAAVPYFEWVPPSGRLQIKASHRILVLLGTTVATGYFVHAYGGSYVL